MIVSNGELNPLNVFKSQATSPLIHYNVRIYYSGDYTVLGQPFPPEILFGGSDNKPLDGNIQIWGNGIESLNTMNKIDYIKISKTDKDGNDNTKYLSQINKLVLSSFNGSTHPLPDNIEYTLEPAFSFEYPTYFSYKVISSTRNSDSDIVPWRNRSYIVDGYIFTGSFQTSPFDITINDFHPSWPLTVIPISKSLGDSLNAFDPTSPKPTYVLPTLNHKEITWKISGSIVTNGSTGGGANASGSLGFYYNKALDNSGFIFSTFGLTGGGSSMNFPPNSTSSIDLTFDLRSYSDVVSYYPPMPGAQISLYIKRGVYNSSNISGCSITEAHFTPDTRIFLSSTVGTGSNPHPSNVKILPAYFAPFFKENYQYSDYNILQGEAMVSRPNPFLQDLDYQSSQTVPVNYQVVVSESATRATVPESNYTQLSNTNIRYNGSKNQSKQINQWTKGIGLTDFSQSFNIGTYGKTSPVEVDDTVIYEFDWGGGTTPEILGWGAYKMGKLLNVKTVDDVTTINPGVGLRNQSHISRWPFATSRGNFNRNEYISQSVSEYYYTLNGNNPINSNIAIYPYETTIGESSPTITKVLTPDFGVPTVSNFILTSSNARYGNITSGSSILELTASVDISRCKKVNGAYTTGETFSPALFTQSPSESITTQLNDGDRWFVTLYNNLEVPINNNNLIPYNIGNSGSLNGEYPNPLSYKGVFEIYGARCDGSFCTVLSLLIGPTNFTENRIIGGNDLGALIWKARAAGDNEFVMVQSEVGSNGPGCFVDQYTTDEIIQNLEKITKNFGSNKQ
jgi:hypothetical protein